MKLKKRTPQLNLEFLEGRLNPAAANISLLTEGLVHSAEFYQNQAEITYQQILGRQPDAAGLQSWVDALKNQGLTTQDMVSRFVASDEFINNNKHDANLMVGFLYQNLIGRKPDPSGLQSWVEGLDNLSTFYYTGKTKNFANFKPADNYGTATDPNFVGLAPQNRTPEQTAALKAALKTIATTFAYEPETLQGTIQSYYTGILGRGASQKEINTWYSYYQNGVRNEDLLKQFIGSQEYQSKFVNTQHLIMGVYEDVLFRPADVQGFKSWSTILDPKSANNHNWVSQLSDTTNLPPNTKLTESQIEKVLEAGYANLVKKNGLQTVPYLAQNDPSFMLKTLKDQAAATLPSDQQQSIDLNDDSKIWSIIGSGQWDTSTGQWVFDPPKDSSTNTFEYHRPTNAVIVVKPGSSQVEINSNPTVNPWNSTEQEYQSWLQNFQQSCWGQLGDSGNSSNPVGKIIDPNKNIIDWKYDFDSGELIPIYGNDGNGDWNGGSIIPTPTPPCLNNWASTDFNGDRIPDFVVANQPGSANQVEIRDGSGSDQVLVGFDPYPGYDGQISIALGDIDGDGTPEIITSSGPGIDANIQAWSITTGATTPPTPMPKANAFVDPPVDTPIDPIPVETPVDSLVATLKKQIALIPGNQDGVIVSTGDLNGDKTDEVLAGTWAGKTPGLITIYDPTQPADTAPLVFAPFGADSNKDITYITTGDINGDGQLDIGVNTSGSWEIQWFDGKTFNPIQLPTPVPTPIDPTPEAPFYQIASADLNEDGVPDWIYANKAGSDKQVTIISGETGNVLAAFDPYPDFTGEVSVTTADINGDGKQVLITGTGPGTAVSVKAWSLTPDQLTPQHQKKEWDSLPPEQTYSVSLLKDIANFSDRTDGVVLEAGDLNGDHVDEILLGTWAGVSAQISIIDTTLPSDTAPVVFSPFGNDSTKDISWLGAQDINGDGQLDIGVSSSDQKEPQWFDGKTLQPIDFQVVNPPPVDPNPGVGNFQVTSADVNHDGIDDWIYANLPDSKNQVTVYSGDGSLLLSFDPYPGWNGLVTVTSGDIDGDGNPELITGTGPGGDASIKAWSFVQDDQGNLSAKMTQDIATIPGMTTGVVLATGDLKGDGKSEIIVGTWTGVPAKIWIYDPTQPPGTDPVSFSPFPDDPTKDLAWLSTEDVNNDGQIDIGVSSSDGNDPIWFDGKTLQPVSFDSINPIDPISDPFPDHFFWASGDLNGDGTPDYVVSGRPGSASQVDIIMSNNGSYDFTHFNPYPGFNGAISLAVGDINGDGKPLIITSTGPGTGMDVQAWTPDGKLVKDLVNFPDNKDGSFIASADLTGDGKAEVILGTWTGITSKVTIYDLTQPADATPVDFVPFSDPAETISYLMTDDINGDGQQDIGVISNQGNEAWFDGKTLEKIDNPLGN